MITMEHENLLENNLQMRIEGFNFSVEENNKITSTLDEFESLLDTYHIDHRYTWVTEGGRIKVTGGRLKDYKGNRIGSYNIHSIDEDPNKRIFEISLKGSYRKTMNKRISGMIVNNEQPTDKDLRLFAFFTTISTNCNFTLVYN